MFRRRRRDQPDQQDQQRAAQVASEPVDDEYDQEPDQAPPERTGPRAQGPWDVGELSAEELSERVDLGGLLLPAVEGIELRLEYDEATGAVGSVLAVRGEAAVQLQPFAAPRSRGIWDEVRAELAAAMTQQGGLATERTGSFGVELLARVPVRQLTGAIEHRLRFVGVDGPRWFLRAVFTGDAYDMPAAAAPLEELVRAAVVVRGTGPMAPREPIPLQLPQAAHGAEPPGGAARPPLDPFGRGPEITEVR